MRNIFLVPLLLTFFWQVEKNLVSCSQGISKQLHKNRGGGGVVGNKMLKLNPPNLKIKGDLGQLIEKNNKDGKDQLRIGRDTYRYYGAGNKGSSSLLPTSPSLKNNFYANEAYGYSPSPQFESYHRPSKSNSIQDYLQVVDALEELPPDFGEMVAETGGHGHGSYGSGGGKGCNNALGLLGVLGLAAYLQNVLNQMQTTTAAPAGRRKRQVEDENVTDSLEDLDRFPSEQNSDLISKLLPVLSAVSHAKDGLIPINCTFKRICDANKFLVNEFRDDGRSIAALISSEIGKMLIPTDSRRAPITMKKVNKVAQLGRNGLPCHLIFEDCDELSFLPTYHFPPSLKGIQLDHPLLLRSGIKPLLEPLLKVGTISPKQTN